MFGPHDSLSAARGARFLASRACVLVAALFVVLAGAPMLLVLLPLAFVGLPFLMVAFLSGASRNRFETRHIQAWQRSVAHAG